MVLLLLLLLLLLLHRAVVVFVLFLFCLFSFVSNPFQHNFFLSAHVSKFT